MLSHNVRFCSVECSEGQFDKNFRFWFGWLYASEHIMGRMLPQLRTAFVLMRKSSICEDSGVKTEQ
jgi:hypothetical protein